MNVLIFAETFMHVVDPRGLCACVCVCVSRKYSKIEALSLKNLVEGRRRSWGFSPHLGEKLFLCLQVSPGSPVSPPAF